MSSRGHVWLLFGCFWVVDSSFFGVSVFFLTDMLKSLNNDEGMQCSLLMSFERAFFNRLEHLYGPARPFFVNVLIKWLMADFGESEVDEFLGRLL